MSQDAVKDAYWDIEHVADRLKTVEMCNWVVKDKENFLGSVPDRFMTQEMYDACVLRDPQGLWCVPDRYKAQEMCNKAVKKVPWPLKHVPDRLETEEQLKIWRDDNKYCNAYELIKWYDGFQKHKTQKAKIKQNLMPIAWHPSCWWNQCVPEDEKKEMENFFFAT